MDAEFSILTALMILGLPILLIFGVIRYVKKFSKFQKEGIITEDVVGLRVDTKIVRKQNNNKTRNHHRKWFDDVSYIPVYSYRVGGSSYEIKGISCTDREIAEKELNKAIKVSYLPNDPSQALVAYWVDASERTVA